MEMDNFVKGLNIGESIIETPYLSKEDIKILYKRAIKVNQTLPYAKFQLAFYIFFHSPRRFLKLSISYLLKQIGISDGLLGT